MAQRHHSRVGCDRSTSSTPGVGRMNLDSRSDYWHPLKRPRQCQKRVGRPESWRPCEALLFSLLKHLRPMRLHQIAAYSSPNGCSEECAVLFAQLGNTKRFFVMAITQCQRGPPVPFAPITISSTVE